MLTSLTRFVRAVLLGATLAFVAPAADARHTLADGPQTTARTSSEAPPASGEGSSVEDILLIGGIVGAVVVFAWVCSRVSDNGQQIMR